MQFVFNFLQKHREKAVLGLLVFLSLTLLILPDTAQFEIAQRTLNALMFPVSAGAGFFEKHFALEDENRRLKRLVASLIIERERLLQSRYVHHDDDESGCYRGTNEAVEEKQVADLPWLCRPTATEALVSQDVHQHWPEMREEGA